MAREEAPRLPPLALTMGEPAGIGPDLTLVAWTRRQELGLPAFYCLSDPASLKARAKALGLACPIEPVSVSDVATCFKHALPVVPLEAAVNAIAGAPDPGNAPAVIEAIARAVGDVRGGGAAAVVTNPINKKTLYDAGFRHPGHTEFLGTLSAAWTNTAARPVMMLAGPELKTVPVTIHIPLKDVPQALSQDLIVETARTVCRELQRRFATPHPRLAVSGLNPHAGEGGAMGDEEDCIVRPAVAALNAEGIATVGPMSADTMFHPAARAGYDAALCMYHDQALIPVKTLSFADTVNVTLGLAFIRTSPDHGTALDIAGTGRGDPSSLGGRLAAGRHALAERNGAMSGTDDLPPLREVIRRHGLRARKSLGQNFLLDLNLTGRIARAAGDLGNVTVVEIGPGPGGLTRALLAAGAHRVVAIERDERCIAALQELARRYPGRLEIVAGDALAVDMAVLAHPPAKIVANLPYNIATPLLIGWLKAEPWPPWYVSMTLMFQQEVAERIVAGPGSDAYGRLSVLARWRCEASILFHVPARAFTPPPKVNSSLVHLVPRPMPLACNITTLERVTQAAFGQRRKMLRQSLKALGVETADLLGKAGIEGTRRAEEIDVAGFVALAHVLEKERQGPPR